MTDYRYQQALNSLVKPNRRTVLEAATSKPPVTGGTGYAAGSEPKQTAVDKVVSSVSGTPFTVRMLGEPDAGNIPVAVVLTLANNPFDVIQIGNDIYTHNVVLGSQIRKNDDIFISTGLGTISEMSGNTTGLSVVDREGEEDDYNLKFFDLDGVLRKKLKNFHSWQVPFWGPKHLAQNDTHYSVTLWSAGGDQTHVGFYLYDNNDNLILRFNPTQIGDLWSFLVALTNTRWYTIYYDDTAVTDWILTVFDLQGQQLDSQIIDASSFPSSTPEDMEVTEWGLWLLNRKQPNIDYFWFPRIDGSELFDQAGLITTAINPNDPNTWPYMSKNRDFTLEY